MKKRVLILSLVFALLLAIPAQAATNANRNDLTLSFSGSTANCTLVVRTENSDDEIEVTMQLWQDDLCRATWTADGSGYLRMSKTKTVTRGETYTLTANVTINGILQPEIIVSEKCI